MTHETLSALLDGECSADELDRLLAEMDRDPQLKIRYSRMTLAREAGDTRIRRADPGFAGRVLAGLDAEPGQGGGSVLPFRSRRVFGAAAPYWRHVTGLALAAGLGAIAVLVLRPENVNPLTQAPVTAAAVPAPEGAEAGLTEVAQRRWSQLDPTDAERLNSYLIAYSQSRAQQGMGSTLGYARYAAHTGEYRPQRMEGPSARTAEVRDTPR